MRTMLDVIVEEEFGFDDKCVRDAGKRIAERAFRHGVEQCSRVGMFDYRSSVQPAPAEEKARVTQVGPAGSFTFTDRRKGERRKVQWWQNMSVCDEKGYMIDYRPVKYPTVDRRSGKDRRKP